MPLKAVTTRAASNAKKQKKFQVRTTKRERTKRTKKNPFPCAYQNAGKLFVARSAIHLVPTATCRFHCPARYFKLRSQMLELDPMIATGMEFDEFPLWVPGG